MKRTWLFGMLAASTLVVGACKRGDSGSAEREDQSSGSRSGTTTGQTDSTRPGGGEQAAMPKSAEGTVGKVEEDSFELKTAAGDTIELDVDANATVDGQPFSVGALTEGSQVRASYTESGGDNKAQTIERLDSGAKSPMEKQPGGTEATPDSGSGAQPGGGSGSGSQQNF